MQNIVAIAFLDREAARHLDGLRQSNGTDPFTSTLALQEGYRDIRGKLVLLVEDEYVLYIAGLSRGRRADDIRRTFDFSSITRLNQALPLDQVRGQLLSSQQVALQNPGGELTLKASEKVLEFLTVWDPGLEVRVSEILGVSSLGLSDERIIALAQERDQIATILDFAQFEPDSILSLGEDDLASRVTFLPEIQRLAPMEDPMVEHDSSFFLGWKMKKTDRLGVKNFSNGRGKNLQIMNVNRSRIEGVTGSDLLYYHVQRKSFVLVQYKRLSQEGKHWLYRPDDQFETQLEAMKKLDAACSSRSETDFRLMSSPSFFKFCRLESLKIESCSPIPGIYLAREQVEMHLADPDKVGRNKGKFFSYENISTHFTSTLFASLVAYGFIGTSGISEDLMTKEIERSLNEKGSVVVGVLDDETGRRAGRPEPV